MTQDPSQLRLVPLTNATPAANPLLLVIADGVGIAPDAPSNAVAEAATPVLDALTSSEQSTQLAAHGIAVGLPTDDDMGNSEVGHNALGAGRVFDQGAKLVNHAIDTGSLFDGEVWAEAMAAGRGGTLHLLGLHSDGNVHAHTNHLYRILERSAADGVSRARVHILHDGRDVHPRSALSYIEATERVLAAINEASGTDFRIGSGGGRMKITMDRYGADWGMVERGYNCHTHGIGRPFSSAAEAVEVMYSESTDGDQYLGEFVVVDADGDPIGTMADGDALIMLNFRGDRAIEISQAYEEAEFEPFDRGRNPAITYSGMLQYDGDALVPKKYLVDPPAIDRTMSEYLCNERVASFAISETQKFGHVTYFWNGNRSGYLDEEVETYVEIASDNVEFNTTPAMKVREITDQTIAMLRSGDYQFGRLNFPSGDMVGHTGDLGATIEAMKVIDECLAELLAVIDELGGVMVFTADHGNADIMYVEKDGARTPVTSHTLSPVALAIHDARSDGPSYTMADIDAPGLANVAATLLNLLGFEAPSGYEPSLISFD